MKHARDDYNRIQDPAGLIPADEPVFLLRAQDKHAAEAVSYYAWLVRRAGGHEIADLSEDQARRMRNWPTHKDPDL